MTRTVVAPDFQIEDLLKVISGRVDALLRRVAEERRHDGPPRLAEALEYALTGGGKRLRPALVLLSCEAFRGDTSDEGLAMRFALALEMIHTYSLVHDDLPCMDDDDLRRGRPTVHKAFDEATAVLVGDGLQSLAFQHLLATPPPSARAPSERADECLRAAQLAALLANGARRMVEGQAIDMAAQGRALSEPEVLDLMARKTGALLQVAVVGGAIAATGSEFGMREVGHRLGLAFQIADDLLDITSDAATLGKRAGKDAAAGKATLPSLVGVPEARRRAETACEEAAAALVPLGPAAAPLRALARYIVTRKR